MWQALRICVKRGWRTWTAVLTAITFALLVSTAVSHRHATSLEDQACSICSVAAHKLTSADPAPVLAQILIFIAYHLPTLVSISVNAVSPLLLPPSCGPPSFA
jgi:hypothetical protein